MAPEGEDTCAKEGGCPQDHHVGRHCAHWEWGVGEKGACGRSGVQQRRDRELVPGRRRGPGIRWAHGRGVLERQVPVEQEGRWEDRAGWAQGSRSRRLRDRR